MLSLMMTFELNNIIFSIRSLKSSHPGFNIVDLAKFETSKTKSSSFNKLKHTFVVLLCLVILFKPFARTLELTSSIDLD